MTCDEVGHLAAGVHVWQFQRFDLYRVNPPLIRTVAATPAVFNSAHTDWSGYAYGGSARPEWSLGQDFIARNSAGWFRYFVWGRWALLAVTLLGGWLCYRWARDLYGSPAGLLALILWTFSPNIAGWAATITPDAAAAALGVLAGWLFWRWLRGPSWARAAWAGLGLALAELTKFTWIILFALWALLSAFWIVTRRDELELRERSVRSRDGRIRTRSEAPVCQLALILVLGVYVINLGYLFQGSCKYLGEYTFISRTLAGEGVNPTVGGNRFSRTWLHAIPVPLPEDYVSGIDLQKLDFEEGKLSYLNGETKHGGWWYYYAYAALLKVPLGTQLLFVIAMALSASG